MIVYIPKRLDIEAIISQNPPNFNGFKKDFLLYVVSTLLMRSQFKKDSIYFAYVPLMAKTLQAVKSNYLDHIKYLSSQNLIECDNTYATGKKAKGYRLNANLGYDIKPVRLTDFVIIKKLRIQRNIDESTLEGLQHLTKWFNNDLRIDSLIVNEYANKKFTLLKDNPELRDKKRLKGKSYIQYKQPAIQFQHTILSALRIELSDFYLKRDSTTNRLHHNLSNMPSIIRNALSYQGKTLCSIDIKNSQPYLSLCLLNEDFWDKKIAHELNQTKPIIDVEAQKSLKTNSTLNINTISTYTESNNHLFNYTMLSKAVKPLINKDFTDYRRAVTGGGFYELLKNQFKVKLDQEFDRKEVKEIVFLILFGGNKGGTKEDISKRNLFQKLFPEVYQVFKTIKRNQKEMLSCLLQSIESYLILEVITKRIAIEYPLAPMFTIHDSIATSTDYKADVERIMIEELEKAVGYKPTLCVDEWNPIKLKSASKNRQSINISPIGI